MQIALTPDERKFVHVILQDRDQVMRKKGLFGEERWVSTLLDKVDNIESQFSINEFEFFKDILKNCTPEDLRRCFGAREVARERRILDGILEGLDEPHIMT